MIQAAWRIEKAKHAAAARSGEGARLNGGRWTSPGRPAIYCAEHLSLAILEILVHAPDSSQRSGHMVRFQVRFDAKLVQRIDPQRLPVQLSPRMDHAISRAFGDAWLDESRTPVLCVPSAIVGVESNYILNPDHSQFDTISWSTEEPIALDDRLWMTR